jgi:mannose-6-phosphate isomerase-like protein (cupin superfamily)
MQTRRLPAEPDAIAPDGSEVRILVALAGGSLAHFSLPPGRVSRAVRHRTVEELWYFVGGRGQMWRRDADGTESVVDVELGVSLDIPLGTAFQFRSTGEAPLAAVGTTLPPWPGDDEAVPADGPWPAT